MDIAVVMETNETHRHETRTEETEEKTERESDLGVRPKKRFLLHPGNLKWNWSPISPNETESEEALSPQMKLSQRKPHFFKNLRFQSIHVCSALGVLIHSYVMGSV